MGKIQRTARLLKVQLDGEISKQLKRERARQQHGEPGPPETTKLSAATMNPHTTA